MICTPRRCNYNVVILKIKTTYGQAVTTITFDFPDDMLLGLFIGKGLNGDS